MNLGPARVSYELRRWSELARGFWLAKRLEKHDRLSRDEIEELQQAKLRQTVSFALGRSAFYRDRYTDLASPEDASLEELPVVTRTELMGDFDRWVTDADLKLKDVQAHLEEDHEGDFYYRRRYRALTTGGSSGKKGVFVYDGREWSVLIAGLLRFMGLIDVRLKPGKRIRSATVAAGHPLHVTYRAATSIDVGAARVLRLEATTPLPRLVEQLNQFAPEWLHAYPSVAALLAGEQLEGRLTISPRVVSTSSELRTPEMTERIEQAWGSLPFDMYGITEVGLFGAECERHRLHALDDLFLFEVVDDANRPVPTGVTGSKILATNLFARTQPLIRYEITDMVAVSEEHCPCGRPFPVLKAVEGRSDDILHLSDGRGGTVPVHPMHFRSPLAQHRDVRQYQIVHRDREILVRVVSAEGAAQGRLEEDLARTLTRELGDAGAEPPPLRFEFVPVIERDPNTMSKLKLVISEAGRG